MRLHCAFITVMCISHKTRVILVFMWTCYSVHHLGKRGKEPMYDVFAVELKWRSTITHNILACSFWYLYLCAWNRCQWYIIELTPCESILLITVEISCLQAMGKLRQHYDNLKERYAVSDVTVSVQSKQITSNSIFFGVWCIFTVREVALTWFWTPPRCGFSTRLRKHRLSQPRGHGPWSKQYNQPWQNLHRKNG